MSVEAKQALAILLTVVGFILGSSTTAFIAWHEYMHIVAYGMVGIRAVKLSRLTVGVTELHWWGVWAAYPFEIMSHAALAWVLAHIRHVWWVGWFFLGFAAGRFFWAIWSVDYNRLAIQALGQDGPEQFKQLLVLVVLPLYLLVVWAVARRSTSAFRAELATEKRAAQ